MFWESWAEIAITVKTEDIETAGNIANMVDSLRHLHRGLFRT